MILQFEWDEKKAKANRRKHDEITVIRIISARTATALERRTYEEGED